MIAVVRYTVSLIFGFMVVVLMYDDDYLVCRLDHTNEGRIMYWFEHKALVVVFNPIARGLFFASLPYGISKTEVPFHTLSYILRSLFIRYQTTWK